MNLLLRIFKFSFPLSLILFPVVAIYGFLQPWQPASEILTAFKNQTPIMIGLSYRSQNNTEVSSRSYVLIPSALSKPQVISVQQINQSSPTVNNSFAGFFIYIGWLVVSIVGTWWFWLTKNSNFPANPSLKRDV